MVKDKFYTIQCTKSVLFNKTKYYYQTGTLLELIKLYKYTLECGQSWEHEKGNKKINCNPKTINQLIKNLNNAVNNSAANGCASETFKLVNKE